LGKAEPGSVRRIEEITNHMLAKRNDERKGCKKNFYNDKAKFLNN
jgi:hypothetical protein